MQAPATTCSTWPARWNWRGAVRLALRGRRRYDGYVALGCVVKGETDHYEFVCREAMAGLTAVALQFALCLGNGLLTVATLAQAEARSSRDGAQQGRRGGGGGAAADRALRAGWGRNDGIAAARPPAPAHRRARRRGAGAVPERAGADQRRDRDRRIRPSPPGRSARRRRVRGRARRRTRTCRCSPRIVRMATREQERIDGLIMEALSRRLAVASGSTRCCAR